MATCPTSSPILLKSSTKAQLKRRTSTQILKRRAHHVVHCSATANGEEVGILGEGQGQNGYLVKRFGWGVRRMDRFGDEMRKVAQVQAEAFHEPVALFNDFFFEFFKAEVLSALIYRIRSSAVDGYACLVAESIDPRDDNEIVGVVDATVQRDADVLQPELNEHGNARDIDEKVDHDGVVRSMRCIIKAMGL